jgi:cellulose synthase/poly-beta-1,6-N-acetylglucosamine synthase-like glycosyltransferase
VLRITRPDLSAATPLPRWQRLGVTGVALALPLGLWSSTDITAMAVMALLTPAFLCVALLRAAALVDIFRITTPPSAAPPLTGDDLPVYSIFVPLYREAHMAPALIAALDRLDWPADRRDILIITEADDAETRDAFRAAIANRPGMRVLTVPAGAPRTKPRALMYALPEAIGEFVVVYDAEDEPDADQLQRAFRRFQTGDPRLGCLQAHLNIYNPQGSWITRQFTLEYTALFDAILPTVERLGLPIPLGGTSNHFRRSVLEESGGWDPYNVTEDADLGVRLARQGWRVSMLDSVTWEEAPGTAAAWFGQRARWLKGWMQTSLVHLRHPRRLWRELGPRAFFGFNVLMGGVILSALVHPLVYAYALWKVSSGDLSLWPPEGWPAVVWWAGVANLAFAYLVGIALTALATLRRHDARLATHALLLPVYWMMISFAAYRALTDLALRPYHWRKTTHTARRQRDKDKSL